MPEARFLQFEIGGNVFYFVVDTDFCLRGYFEGEADEPGEIRYKFVGSPDVFFNNIFLDRIEAIEDKMRVHLRLQRHLLELGDPVGGHYFFFILGPERAYTQGDEKPEEAAEDCGRQDNKAGFFPQ